MKRVTACWCEVSPTAVRQTGGDNARRNDRIATPHVARGLRLPRLIYDFNYYSYDHFRVTSTSNVPAGKVQLKMDFKYDGGGPGRGGTATLFINGEQVGSGRIEKTIPGKFGFDGMDVGMDLSSAVSEDYKPPFKFSGTVKKVTIDINE